MAQRETERLNQMILGVALSKALCTVAELGVADHIESGSARSARYLAKTTGSHEQSLYRLLRFLASYGLFHETPNGEFEHTALSEVLRSGAEGSYRAGALMFNRIFRAWDGLEHAVRTGQPGFGHVYGMPVFEYLTAHPQLAPIFDAGMTCFHGYETDAMLDVYDLGAVAVLADIGGGNGSLMESVLRRYPRSRGILFDLGHVVTRARERLKQHGLSERCQIIEGSFFESIPTGADTYLFRHILHDWTDEQCVQILRHRHRVIPAHGTLLVVECVIPIGNDRSVSKDFDMTMLTFPGGLERTEPEFRSLFRQAGFELVAVKPTSTMVSVIEGKVIDAA